jgi:phosphoglycerate dehydrogenase-like enzyme
MKASGRPSVLVTIPEGPVRDDFFPSDVVLRLEALTRTTWNDTGHELSQDELRALLPGKNVCLTGWGTRLLGKEILAGGRDLGLIVHTGGTVAGIVDEYAFQAGIKVASANSIMAESVAESVICYALCGLREVPFYNEQLQRGIWWQDCTYHYEGLLDKTVGLVGFGTVARFLVDMLQPFRARVKAFDPFVGELIFREYERKGVLPSTLEEVFSCQIVSIHASLTPETIRMVDARLLSLIPRGGLLINTARGKLIDEEALATELARARFTAVLDVYGTEPLPGTSPLRGLRNAILLPHMAGPTSDRRCRMTHAMIDEIERFSKEEPLQFEISRTYASRMTQKI